MPPLIWMIVIFTASTDLMSAHRTSRLIEPLLRWLLPDISASGILAVQFFARKAAHLTEYAVLAALLWRALWPDASAANWRNAGIALSIAIAYAALDEFHQSFVASRGGSPFDVMIDATGAAVGLLLYWLLVLRRRGPAPAAAALRR